jgi:TolA-binding protein
MQRPRIHVVLILAAAALWSRSAAILADEASDQFAVAAGHYGAQRWELAAEEFQRFLADYPQHPKRTKAAFFLGEALVQTGKFDEAGDRFAAVIEADPKGRYARQALFRAGECRFLAGKTTEASADLSKFREQFADDPLCAYALGYLGELALRSDDFATAKSRYAEVLEQFADGPTADDCRLGLAQALLRLKEYGDAKSVLESLVADERLTAEANYWLGQVYKAQEQWAAAAAAFQAGLAAAPEHAGAETLRYLAGESLVRAAKYTEAIETLRGADAPRDVATLPAAHGYLVAIAQQSLKQHGEALATLDAVKVDVNHELARRVLTAQAASLVALGRDGEAIELLIKCLQATPEGDAAARSATLARLAVSYARVKDFEHAKSALRQLSDAAGPTSELVTHTCWEVARVAMAARQTAIAGELNRALADQQTTPEVAADAQMNLARMAVDAGEPEKAAQLYEQFLQDHPEGAQAVEAALACAAIRERLEQNDAALAMYHLIIERHAESEQLPQALLRAATLYDRLAQEAKAIELFERLTHDFPGSDFLPAATYGWAWCLRDLKRVEEANAKFEQVRRDYPHSAYWADATYRLAESAAQAKDLDRAMTLVNEIVVSAGSGTPATATASDEEPEPQENESSKSITTERNSPADNQGAARVPTETLRHALYLRAQIAIAQSKWSDAEGDLARLMNEHGASPLAMVAEFLHADVAYRRADYDAAAKRFTDLATKVTQRNDRWIPMIPLRRAQIYAQQKRWSDARAVAAAIAKDHPTFDQLYEADYVIGRSHAAEANLDAAREAYNKVLRSPQASKTETAAMAQWMIGETYFLQEQYATAIREYLRVEVLYAYPRWQAAALLQAGKCHEQMGQWKDAAAAYERLITHYAQTDFAAEAQERLRAAQSRTAARPKR